MRRAWSGDVEVRIVAAVFGRRRGDSSIRIIGSGDLVPSRTRRHRRRIRPVLVLLLVVAVGVGAFLGGRELWDRVRTDDTDTSSVATPQCTPVATPPPLLKTTQVAVRIYNATPRQGLGAQTAQALEARGFRIAAIGNTGPVQGVVQVRSAAAGARHARTLAMHVPQPQLVVDNRIKGTVDLVLGPGFTRLLTPQEVTAAVAAATRPTPAAACS